MRLIGVVERGVSKPLGRVHLFPPGTDATGSRAYTPVSGATAIPLDLVVPQTVAGKTANGVGVGSPTPTTWMDEHRHGDEGGEW